MSACTRAMKRRFRRGCRTSASRSSSSSSSSMGPSECCGEPTGFACRCQHENDGIGEKFSLYWRRERTHTRLTAQQLGVLKRTESLHAKLTCVLILKDFAQAAPPPAMIPGAPAPKRPFCTLGTLQSRMSSYVLLFGLGDFDSSDPKSIVESRRLPAEMLSMISRRLYKCCLCVGLGFQNGNNVRFCQVLR
jgi:hypothetical protein